MRQVAAMGGMMGSTDTWAWILLWIFLGLAVAVITGIAVARALNWHSADQARIGPPEPPAAQQARDALRLRYAKGEISREEYLQGKVELEDSP
jgi:putative membrane protein